MTFRVLHAPLHGPSAAQHPMAVINRIRDLKADTTGLTEATRPPLRHALTKAPGLRYINEDGADDPRGQHDTAILVRDTLRSLGSGQVQACNAARPRKIAPERWFTFSTVDTRQGPVTHIAGHLHAAIQDDAGRLRLDTTRGRETAAALVVLDSLLDLFPALGHHVVVTADLNFRQLPGYQPGPSPYKLLATHGLTIVAHGLDVMASSPALDLEVTEVPASSTITNHPWLLGVAS